MASTATYAATPNNSSAGTVALVTTGDTSRTAPTNFAYAYTAGANGARLDRLDICSVGTTTASTYRLFVVPGTPGVAISSITFSTTTATVTTASNHGLSTGMKVTIKGAYPNDYNVSHATVNVSSTTVFTYTMATNPTTNAVSVGTFSYTPSSPTFSLWQERPVTAVTPSGTVQVFQDSLTTQNNPGLFPLILQAGYSLAASVNDTQAGLNFLPISAGDF